MNEESCPLKKNILITGAPGVGKTTVIMEIIERLGNEAGGFYTEEIREKGTRVGFILRTLGGRNGVLARKGMMSYHKVGSYGVDIVVLEEIGVRAIKEAIGSGRVVVIDEIGAMEMISVPFRRAVMEALVSPPPVVATIQWKQNAFCDSLKGRPDVHIVELDRENRNYVPRLVLGMLESYALTPVKL